MSRLSGAREATPASRRESITRTSSDAGLQRCFDLNRLGVEKVARGGILVTCSCSGSVSEDRFVRMLRDAAAAAHRDVRELHLRGAGPDHPVALECPETRYLEVAVLQVR